MGGAWRFFWAVYAAARATPLHGGMAFVLNIFRGEKKDNLGFLPSRGALKAGDKKAKKNDLEDIADEFMRKEEYTVQSDRFACVDVLSGCSAA